MDASLFDKFWGFGGFGGYLQQRWQQIDIVFLLFWQSYGAFFKTDNLTSFRFGWPGLCSTVSMIFLYIYICMLQDSPNYLRGN